MFHLYRVKDVRASDYVGVPLVFMSDAEASIWMIRQKFISDLILVRIADVVGSDVKAYAPEEVPYNAYEVTE